MRRICAWLIITAALLSACSTGGEVTSTPPGPVPETPAPTPTSPPAPLGSADNPLVIGFVSIDGDPDLQDAARELAVRLTVQTGYAVSAQVYPSHPELIAALRAGDAHAAWLQPLTYIYATQQNLVEVALLTNHFGTYYYGTQFLANVESGYTSYFDPASNQNTSDAQTALAQLDGARPCWVSPDSISGYVLPYGILHELGMGVADGAYINSSTGLVRALYIKGICDFGATFALSGDPRTSTAVTDDLPDVLDRVMVIWRSEAVIPSLNFSYLANIPAAAREALNARLMELVGTAEGRDLLTRALDYDVQDLRVVDDSVYDPLRGAVQRARVPLQDTLGQ